LLQETVVLSLERHYTVFVSCPDKDLTHFPKLPKHTRTVDLSNNKVTYGQASFDTLSLGLLVIVPKSLKKI
jgi:hypothetical protein